MNRGSIYVAILLIFICVILSVIVGAMLTVIVPSDENIFSDPTQTFENKHIQVKSIYPRTDAYMNHYDPYVVTMDGEIYDVSNDLQWAKLTVGMNYTAGGTMIKSDYRSGSITSIKEEK